MASTKKTVSAGKWSKSYAGPFSLKDATAIVADLKSHAKVITDAKFEHRKGERGYDIFLKINKTILGKSFSK